MKLILILVISTTLIFQKCSQKPKILVSSEYIINEYWKDPFSNFFEINRMHVKKDSILDLFAPGFNTDLPNHWNIVEKLEADSLHFHYISNNKTRITGDTIFFSKKNDGKWFRSKSKWQALTDESDFIESLEKKTWYQFSHLRPGKFYLFVYIDSTGQAHCFKQDLSNY